MTWAQTFVHSQIFQEGLLKARHPSRIREYTREENKVPAPIKFGDWHRKPDNKQINV